MSHVCITMQSDMKVFVLMEHLCFIFCCFVKVCASEGLRKLALVVNLLCPSNQGDLRLKINGQYSFLFQVLNQSVTLPSNVGRGRENLVMLFSYSNLDRGFSLFVGFDLIVVILSLLQ